MKKTITKSLIILILLLLIFLLKDFIARPIGSLLVLQDPLKKSDAIIILGGEKEERARTGAELFKKGYADKVVVTGGIVVGDVTFAKLMSDQIQGYGVPKSAVILEDKAVSTYENAKFVKDIMTSKGFSSAIIVSSPYHMRRSKMIFDKVFQNSNILLSYYPSRDKDYLSGKWWNNEEKRKFVFSEYIKLIYYLKYFISDILKYIIVLLASFIASLLLVPIVKKLSEKLNLSDKPQTGKIHAKPVSRLGGIAIVSAFILTVIIAKSPIVFIVCALASCLLGLADDIKNISAARKLAGETLIAVFLFYFGVRIAFLPIYVSALISIFWLVGFSNSVNLTDGLDGLAAGTSAVSAFFFFIIALLTGQAYLAMICLALIGALIGFLKYNFYPASIFMGDSGSLFIGFTLGIIAVLLANKIGPIVPLIILALPIFDTLFAVARRIINHKPVFESDLGHFYNLLMNKIGHKQAVLVCYLIAFILGLSGLLFVF